MMANRVLGLLRSNIAEHQQKLHFQRNNKLSLHTLRQKYRLHVSKPWDVKFPLRNTCYPILDSNTQSRNTALIATNNNFLVCSISTSCRSQQGSSKGGDDLETTHFGFKTVQESEKEDKVYEVFKNVAEKYDLMNDVMSVGIHRLWKDEFIRQLSPQPGMKLIDVAGGTGDIAFRYLNFNGGSDAGDEKREVTVCDINDHMLSVGEERATQNGITEGISWLHGNAECLSVEDNQFDAYTIAFGIRNCTHVKKVLQEAYRVLKPGGRFMCLEFSKVRNPLLRTIYDQYSFQVIPVMGHVIAQDWHSYQYLVESIRQFPDQETFASWIEEAGFTSVTVSDMTFGAVAIHSGFKL